MNIVGPITHGIVQTNLFSSICNKYSILHIYFCWKNWCVYPESDIKFEQPCNGDLNFLHKYMYFLAVKKKLIFDEGKFTKNYIMYVNLNGIPCKPKSAKFVTGLKKTHPAIRFQSHCKSVQLDPPLHLFIRLKVAFSVILPYWTTIFMSIRYSL